MTRKILSISVPVKVEKWVRNRVERDNFDSISDYIRELIENDRIRLRNRAHIGPIFDSLIVPGSTFSLGMNRPRRRRR